MGRIISISQLKIGEKGSVIELRGGSMFQKRVRIMGIKEGREVKLITKQPIGGPVTVEVLGIKITLGRRMADRILVKVR